MKDYTIDKNLKKNYITKFVKIPDGTYTVEFADGSCFKRIIADEDNLRRINHIQRKQADEGIKNYSKLKNRLTKSGVMTAVNLVGVAGTCSLVASFPCFDNFNLQTVACGVGLVTIISSIPSFSKLKKNFDVVVELDKIKYVDAHRNVLNSFRNHVNALAGVDKKTADYILSSDNPFSIENIENVSLSDLKLIVSNIIRENQLGFTYKKIVKRIKKYN